MEAKQLRIGNLVYQSGEITRVESLERSIDDWDRTNHKRTMDCKPIDLTDEWFEKIERFYKDGEYWCIDINDYKYCFNYRDWAKNWAFYQEFTDSPDSKDDGVKYPVSFDIQYVHQLQNLYFALQHEELKLKQ